MVVSISIAKNQGLLQSLRNYARSQNYDASNINVGKTIEKLKEIQAQRKANNKASIYRGGDDKMIVSVGAKDFSKQEMDELFEAMGLTIKGGIKMPEQAKTEPLTIQPVEQKPVDTKIDINKSNETEADSEEETEEWVVSTTLTETEETTVSETTETTIETVINDETAEENQTSETDTNVFGHNGNYWEYPVADDETPVAEETVEETVNETPVVEETVNETPVVEETVDETVEETPVVEETVEENQTSETNATNVFGHNGNYWEYPVAADETPVAEETAEETPVAEETTITKETINEEVPVVTPQSGTVTNPVEIKPLDEIEAEKAKEKADQKIKENNKAYQLINWYTVANNDENNNENFTISDAETVEGQDQDIAQIADDFIQLYDNDGDGKISYNEIREKVYAQGNPENKTLDSKERGILFNKAQAIFHTFNVDNTEESKDNITKEEIMAGIVALDASNNERLATEESKKSKKSKKKNKNTDMNKLPGVANGIATADEAREFNRQLFSYSPLKQKITEIYNQFFKTVA